MRAAKSRIRTFRTWRKSENENIEKKKRLEQLIKLNQMLELSKMFQETKKRKENRNGVKMENEKKKFDFFIQIREKMEKSKRL